MASIFGHIISAVGIGSVFPADNMTPKVFLIGSVSAALPDVDVLSNYFGIWGLDMLGHRGITHSISFALVWTAVLLIVFHRQSLVKPMLSLYYFICTVSHGLLDGLTTGGDGIAYFAPFSSYRTHLPWHVIQVSPLGVQNFFSEWGVKVILSEFFWIALPSLFLILTSSLIRKWR